MMTGDTLLYRNCVYPFVLFLGMNLLLFVAEGSLQWEHPDAAWWQQEPMLLIYPLQVLVCGAYLWYVRRGIPRDWSWRASALGALFGVVGIAAWLVPYVAGWIPAEGGFAPEEVLGQGTAATALQYGFRFARAVLIVPLVEELFWRGFLMRWCVNRDFPQTVPLGTHSWLAYVVTTAAFMLVHNPVDYAGAWVYGSLAYALVVLTRRLTPAFVMHAVANFIMGWCAVYCNLPHLW